MKKRRRTPPLDQASIKRNISTAAEHPINEYNGWTVPTKNYTIPTINISDVTPEIFYKNFIHKRRPVVLNGLPSDLSLIERWKDFNCLTKRVGDLPIMVEKRSSETHSFGNGNEVKLLFRQFIQLICNGDDKHYMTTQDVHANADGRPDLMSPFMKTLSSDFPLRPILMGNLIPQNINLWIGNSSNEAGTSSGLHHDYHDNLYIVVKGRKRFRLYSPMNIDKMYMRGELLRVHPNGRINYKGEETTAYGADLLSDAAAKAARLRRDAERALEDAELAVEEGKSGAQEQLDRAEQQLDEAIDAVLDAEVCDEEEDDDDDLKSESIDDCEYGNRHRLVDKTVKNPTNFSNIGADCLNDEKKLKENYPNILHANAAFCDIESGSALYLPASWFHEVRSYGTSIALNYWFHPPDGNDFSTPYSSDFWPNDFSERVEKSL